MADVRRTYIRAITVGISECIFELPEWKRGVWIHLSKRSVPPYERVHLHPGYRCYVDINFNAKTPDHLNITKWGLI